MNERKPEWYVRLKAYPFDRKTFTIGKIYKIEKQAAEGNFDLKGRKRNNRLAALFAAAACAMASAVVLFVAIVSNGGSIPLKPWGVQQVSQSPEKITKTNKQHGNNQGDHKVDKYISENEALQIAKQMDPDGKAEWSVEFVKDFQAEPDKKEVRPSWKVTATYPPGNKMIVYLDAVTGEQLVEIETESNW